MPTKKAKTAKKAGGRRTRKSQPTVHQLKVTLSGSTPPIWRRFVVPSEINLGALHIVLQAVMDWSNSHLHQYQVDGRRISDPEFELDEFEGDEPVLDEHAVPLSAIAPRAGDRFVYEYDFGDGWCHDVVVEEVRPLDEQRPVVWCLDGARACPPDDCGGLPGYEELLAAMSDRHHPEHEQMVQWAGGVIDAERFDPRAVNRELARWVLSQS